MRHLLRPMLQLRALDRKLDYAISSYLALPPSAVFGKHRAFDNDVLVHARSEIALNGHIMPSAFVSTISLVTTFLS